MLVWKREEIQEVSLSELKQSGFSRINSMSTRLYILLLIFVGFIIYLNILPNKFIGDDVDQIVRNPTVHSIQNIPNLFMGSTYISGGSAERLVGLFYRPIMMSSFAVIYSMFGADPLYFHVVQIILHTLVSIGLFYFFKRFVSEALAFAGALVFLVHPIHSETVAYIADLQDVLFVLFGMVTLLLARHQVRFKPYKFQYLGLIFVTLLLTLLSKESGILFFPMLILYLILVEKKPWRTITRHSVIAACSLIAYLILRYGVAQMYTSKSSLASIAEASFTQRLIHIPLIITTYLKTFFWPARLLSLQIWFIEVITWQNFYVPLAFVLFFGLLLSVGYRQLPKDYKATSGRYYIFFLVWFLIGLGLHLQMYPLDMTVAERWFYFPSIGLIGVILILLSQIRLQSIFLKRLTIGLFIMVILILSYRTHLRNNDWKDAITLYEADLIGVQGNFIMENALATEYISIGEYKKAKPFVSASIKTKPTYANLNNMAVINVEEGKIDEAKQNLISAVKSGRNFYVYENFSNFLLVYDKPEQAKIFATHALKSFPQNANLWLTLAQAEYFLNNKNRALVYAQKSLQLSNSEKSREIYQKIKSGQPIIQLRKAIPQ